MTDENKKVDELQKQFDSLIDKIHNGFSEYAAKEKKAHTGEAKTYIVTPPDARASESILAVMAALEMASRSLDAITGKAQKTNGHFANPMTNKKGTPTFTREEILFIEETFKKLSNSSE
jgi:hypothetical protein